MPQLFTLTLHTAIDQIITIPHFEMGKAVKATHTLTFGAGKGINVARTIAGQGRTVTALGFTGKAEEAIFSALQSDVLNVALITVAGNTRRNLTITDQQHTVITHIQQEGYTVNQTDIEALTQQVFALVLPNDLIVISGSLPKGVAPLFYQQLIEQLEAKQVQVIFDASGEALKEGIKAQPFLIKPNIEELEDFAGKPLHDEKEIVTTARQIAEAGVRYVVVSRGEKGIIAVEQGKRHYWKAFFKPDIVLETFFTVGSGDALVGGLAIHLTENKPFEEALRLGIACATANLSTPIAGEAPQERVNKLLNCYIVELLYG